MKTITWNPIEKIAKVGSRILVINDFWIQRIIMKTNVAAGADYLYQFRMICAPTRAQDIMRRRL